MPESKDTKSRRDLFGERLRAKYPDREFADDEALFGQADDDYADYEEQLGKYHDYNDRLNEVLARNPEGAQFITDMANGKNPWIAVVERMGIDGVTDMMNDPDKQEEIAEANKKFVERLAKEQSLEEEYQMNFAESMKSLERMQHERGLTDEVIDGAMDLLMAMVNDAIVGKFSEETIEMALKAMSRDADIENARSEGEIAGRNAKIEERLRRRQDGDGMPTLDGKNNTGVPKRRMYNVFDLADAAK